MAKARTSEVTSIFARSCLVSKIDGELANQFVNENHSQGATKSIAKIVSLGLFHGDELVGVIQFCHPRTKRVRRLYSTELLRLAFKKNVRIVGGASKLVNHYKKNYQPADIFTYQDTSGEGTAVYEHCGFTLVSQDKKKQYLVAPGKTLKTGNRKEILGIPYVTQYGPDRILGTKLGEVIDSETGKRKSNKRIFLEDLGWHLEETSGDRIYEWFNPDVTFYVYRITAADSEKYYIGVHRLNKAYASELDCLNDGYYGSGGVKFRNWLARHYTNVNKEILFISDKKMEAYLKEEELVGSAYRDDPLCLNSRVGGGSTPPNSMAGVHLGNCPLHGSTQFMGNLCRRCMNLSNVSMQICPRHGEVSHYGKSCYVCSSEKALTRKECSTHGAVTFKAGKCLSCGAAKHYTTEICSVHGETIHRSGKCATCFSEKVFSSKECEVHGETRFVGAKCSKCIHSETFQMKKCSVHGETKHKGEVCWKCSKEGIFTEAECPVHGPATFQGDSCVRCVREKSFYLAGCGVHGETKHRGGVCSKCEASSNFSQRECPVHGLTKHNKSSCSKCAGAKRAHKRYHADKISDSCVLCQGLVKI